MLPCCLCLPLGTSPSDYDETRLEPLLEHAEIHKSQINRFAKTRISKVFADCFPKIAVNFTGIVESMETPRNSGSNDGTEGKATSVPAEIIKEASQRQGPVLVKNTKMRSPVHKRGKRASGQSAKVSIRVRCRKILESSCDKRQQRFRCGVCNDQVVLRTGQKGGFDTGRAIAHVLLRHTDIKPIRCRYCDHTTKDRSSMGTHVKQVHQVSDYRSAHFINEINAHKKEICGMVATCFGEKQWKAIIGSESDTKIKLTKRYNDTMPVADNGNQSAKHDGKRNAKYDGKRNRPCEPSMITAHCRQTTARYSKAQRRFKCGICRKFVTLRCRPNAPVNSGSVAQHVLSHMDIKPYRCRYCTVAVKTQRDMCYHVKYAHNLAASGTSHYINEMSVHEKEICDMITVCFGKKEKLISENKKSV